MPAGRAPRSATGFRAARSGDAGTPAEAASCASSGDVTLVSLRWAGSVALPLALNDASAFWLYSGPGYADGGSVMTVPKCGGAAATLASGQPFLGSIAVDSENVYWTNLSSQDHGTLMSVPVHGGAPVTLSAGGDPAGLALDATSIYWTDPFGGTVNKIPKASGGGAPTTLATKQYGAGDLATNATLACWTRNNGNFPDTPV